MTTRHDIEAMSPEFDRLMTAWFDAEARVHEPDDLLERTISQRKKTRPRPAWLLPERWIPMELTMRRVRLPRAAPFVVLVAVAILVAALAMAITGSPRPLPSPFGPAANGLIAYISDGQLWTTMPDGSVSRAITSDDTVKRAPVWSRDGTRLAYVANTSSTSQDAASLIVTDADGGHPVTIERDARALHYVSWSPDGRTIAFSKWIEYPGQRDRVFLAASDGSSAPRQIGDPTLSAFDPSFSPDGARILFVSDLAQPTGGEERFALHAMNSDGTDIRQLTRLVVTIGSFDESDEPGARGFEWSPDGTQVLFTGSEVGVDTPSLYLAAADGRTSERRLDPEPQYRYEYGGAWAPTGAQIAYLFGERGTAHRVVVANADGSAARIIAENVPWVGPLWSPDGRSIVVSAPDAAGESLRILSADGTGTPAVIRTSGIDTVGWQRVSP